MTSTTTTHPGGGERPPSGMTRPGMSKMLWSSLTLLASINGLSAATGLDAAYLFDAPPSGQPAFVERTDQTVNLSTSPSPVAGYPTTYYSATWTGSITAPTTGTYTFYVTADDCARLWVGTNWIAQRLAFSGGTATTVQGTIDLTAGKPTPLLLRFWQLGGTARALLEWSGPGITRQTVPASVLSPTGWTRVMAPATSYESPVSAIAHVRPQAVPQISATPAANLIGSVQALGPTAQWAEVKLSPTAPVTVSLKTVSETASASITWQVIDFSTTLPSVVNVRAGSSILVKPRAGGVPYVTLGYTRTKTTAVPSNGLYQVPLTAAGDCTLDDNLGGTSVKVNVIKIDADSQYANSTLFAAVDYFSAFVVPVIPTDAGTSITTGSYEHNLFVMEGTQTSTGYTLAGLVPYSAGDLSKGFIRLNDNGSIVSLVKATGVSVGMSSAVIDKTNADGSSVGHAFASIYPFAKNLQYTITMRAHTATFLGGNTSFTTKTDGSATSLGEPGFTQTTTPDGTVVGSLKFTLLFPPGETKWCFTADPQQIAP